jgi:hypothetical protein
MGNKKTVDPPKKHKGDEYETDRDETDGCCVCIGIGFGNLP